MDNSNLIKEITDNLPIIEIEIDYDGDIGLYDNDDYEIEFERYLIRCHISIKTERKITEQDYLQPEESENQIKEIYIFINEVWEQDFELIFNKKEKRIISESIENNIYLSN